MKKLILGLLLVCSIGFAETEVIFDYLGTVRQSDLIKNKYKVYILDKKRGGFVHPFILDKANNVDLGKRYCGVLLDTKNNKVKKISFVDDLNDLDKKIVKYADGEGKKINKFEFKGNKKELRSYFRDWQMCKN